MPNLKTRQKQPDTKVYLLGNNLRLNKSAHNISRNFLKMESNSKNWGSHTNLNTNRKSSSNLNLAPPKNHPKNLAKSQPNRQKFSK